MQVIQSNDDESSDKDNRNSTNNSKDRGRSSDGRADESDIIEQCQEVRVFESHSGTAVEACDSSCSEDTGPSPLAPTFTYSLPSPSGKGVSA